MFRYDNPIMKFLGKVFDVMIVNILWVICSLPFITIGASTTAMYYVMLKIARNEDGNTIRSFFDSFANNFKQATIIWSMMLFVPVLVVSYLYFYLCMIETTDVVQFIIISMATLVTVAWIAVFSYIFPLIATFKNPIKQTIYNAFAMSIANLSDTATMLFIDVGLIYLTLKVFPLLGFAGIAWFNSYRLNKIFNKYIDSYDEPMGDLNE